MTTFELPQLPDWIPQPETYRLLVLPPTPKKQTSGGIIIPEDSQDAEGHFQYVGKIVALGPSCFKDRAEFKHYTDEQRPKVGEFIVFGSKDGMKIDVLTETGEAVTLRLLSDTSVLARVSDPTKFKFYY